MALCGPQGRFPIQINAFITPSSVWATETVRRGMSEERHQLHILEQRLSSLLKDDRHKRSSQLRQEGELIAIRSLHDSRKWHRGRIESALQLPTGYKYSVVLIDHGDTLRAKGDHIRDLPLDFHSLPSQAMKLVLEGVVPITLQMSLENSSSSHEMSLTWKPSAQRFVDDILRNYESASFDEHSRKGQVRIGDIFLTLPDQGLVSLSKLLCENNYAVHSMDKFCERQQIFSEDFNLPQLCPSPPAIASSSGTSSSCAPSPANAMVPSISSGSEASGRQMSFSEYYEMKKKNPKKFDKTTSLKESSKSASDSDNDKKPSKLDLLRSLKKSSVIQEHGTSEKKPSAHNSSEPLEENPMPTPKALDSAYVPAGRSIIKTFPKKEVRSWSKAEKNPFCHNSLSEDDTFTFSEKPQHHTRGTKTSGSSDSSDAKSQRIPKKQASMQRALNAPDATQSSYPQFQQTDDHVSPEASLTSGPRQKLPPWLSRKNNFTCENSKESYNGLKEGQCTTILSHQSNLHSSVAQENELHSKAFTPLSSKSHKLRDHHIDGEEFLARDVLVHGGFAPSPCWTQTELKTMFSTHTEQFLNNMKWTYSILTLQKFMWPAIQTRQNVVMVSPPKSGKSSSYIIPLMDFMFDSEQIPRGNGPLVIILCAGSKAVDNTHKDCLRVVNGIKNAPRVEKLSGLGLSVKDLLKLVNGCEVFITTPPCLLRILEDHKNSYALNFKRLCHYVLDQADILMTKFLHEMEEIQHKVVSEQVIRTKSEARPIQVIISSEKWEPRLLSFSWQVLGNPLLVINDCYEACVYGKPEVQFHLTRTENKLNKLTQILREIGGLHKTIVFCNQCEVAEVEKFLTNACMNILAPSAGASITHFEVFRERWDTTTAGHHYTLVCTDADFDCFRRRDATCLVHYSLPMQDKTYFTRRLGSILDNLPNVFEPKSKSKRPEIHLIMDGTNSDQLPVITKLMQRISDKVQLDTKLLQAAQAASEMKEIKTKFNKLFCKDLKMYGQCMKSNCPNRHVFMPELDESCILPRSGWVTLEVVHVHSTAHFSARLIEHIAEDGSKILWPSNYFKLCALLAKHFNHIKNPNNEELKTNVCIGDIYAVETVENLYHRVQVLEILGKDKRGNPQLVLVQFLDEGKQQPFQVFALHKLPETLQAFPAQVIDIFLCGLLPADQDDDYGIDGKYCVQKWMKKSGDQESERNTHLQGKIVLSMTGTLLVDCVHIMEWLPHMKTNVKRMNIKEKLLAGNYALENPDHISQLFKLCGKDESALVPQVVKTPNLRTSNVKPEWAFLERDMFEDIHFVCAEDLENISVLFVQKMKFQSLLETLVNEINQAPPKQKLDNGCFEGGDFCLALYEEKWYRAQILSKSEESFTVFYVDYGNTRDVSVNELQCIPDWAITKLPFQAIECSLAGVSSCDVANKIRDLTDDGVKTLYAKVAEHKNAIVTGGKHFVVAVVHVDFSKPDTSIINKDLLALDGVKPCQNEMRYLDFDLDISMFHQESLSEDESAESGEQGVNQFEDLNVSDLEFKDEGSSEASENEGFDFGFDINGDIINEFLKADPEFEATLKEAISHGRSPISQDTSQAPNITGDNVTGASNNTQQPSERKVVTEQGQNLSDWEEDGDTIGRYNFPPLLPARAPRTKWVEDLYYVWLKICLSEVDSYYLNWTHNSIQFSATVGGRIYHLNQQLRGVIWPDSVKPCFKGFTIELKLKKACSGIFWGRPFASKRRFPWLSCDLEATAGASSDSDCGLSLEAINKEIRKIPVNLRRRKTEMKGRTPKPDLASDSGGSKSDNEMDSDEMF